jgi:hypothetical protein
MLTILTGTILRPITNVHLCRYRRLESISGPRSQEARDCSLHGAVADAASQMVRYDYQPYTCYFDEFISVCVLCIGPVASVRLSQRGEALIDILDCRLISQQVAEELYDKRCLAPILRKAYVSTEYQ